jgi:hypothetical protein
VTTLDVQTHVFPKGPETVRGTEATSHLVVIAETGPACVNEWRGIIVCVIQKFMHQCEARWRLGRCSFYATEYDVPRGGPWPLEALKALAPSFPQKPGTWLQRSNQKRKVALAAVSGSPRPRGFRGHSTCRTLLDTPFIK